MPKMVEVSHEDQVLRAFMLFMQVGQAAYKFSDRHFYGIGVSTATFIALKGLAARGGVMTHTELAEWTNTEKHNITTLVDRMKKDGLVTSEYSQVDRRVAHIKITDKGRKAYEKAAPVSREIMERVMRGVRGDGAAQLEKALKKMKTNVQKALG